MSPKRQEVAAVVLKALVVSVLPVKVKLGSHWSPPYIQYLQKLPSLRFQTLFGGVFADNIRW